MVREAMKLNAANQKQDQRKRRLEELQTELLEAQAEERVAALLIDEMKRSLPALPVILVGQWVSKMKRSLPTLPVIWWVSRPVG